MPLGVWSKMLKFIRPFMESPLKSKIEKRALLPHFTVFVQIFAGEKITNFSPSSLWRSDSFYTPKLTTFVLAFALKIIGLCKKNFF